MIKFKYIIILILLFLAGFSLNAQNIIIKGKITNTLQSPLSNVNILAVPESENTEIRFAITNQQGEYKLKLEKNKSYKVTVSNLGFLL